MSTVTVDCSRLNGEVRVPYSKSILHRYLICSFIDGDYDVIRNIEQKVGILADDVAATRDCLIALINNESELCCRESGTTLRFIIPLAAALGRNCDVIAEGSLVSRPMSRFIDELNRHGADISVSQEDDREIFHIRGKLEEGDYELPGNISSQFISGIMLASDLIDGYAWIIIEDDVESTPYIDMTVAVIKAFDMGRGDKMLEGDWSAGAIWVVANDLLEGRLKVDGLSPNSIQGDSGIIDILNDFAIGEVMGQRTLTVDASDCPDLVPAIALRAVKAAMSGVGTVITGAGRLKYKESNRLNSISAVLNKLGAVVDVDDESLIIHAAPADRLAGTDEAIDCYNDHRVVMLAAMASILTDKPVKIAGAEAVNKSYPEFFMDLERMGGVNETEF